MEPRTLARNLENLRHALDQGFPRAQYLREGIAAALAHIEAITQENTELEQLFDLQHTRTVQADMAWREAHPGNDLVLPDLGTLVDWLLVEKRAADLEPVVSEILVAENTDLQAELDRVRAKSAERQVAITRLRIGLMEVHRLLKQQVWFINTGHHMEQLILTALSDEPVEHEHRMTYFKGYLCESCGITADKVKVQ